MKTDKTKLITTVFGLLVLISTSAQAQITETPEHARDRICSNLSAVINDIEKGTVAQFETLMRACGTMPAQNAAKLTPEQQQKVDATCSKLASTQPFAIEVHPCPLFKDSQDALAYCATHPANIFAVNLIDAFWCPVRFRSDSSLQQARIFEGLLKLSDLAQQKQEAEKRTEDAAAHAQSKRTEDRALGGVFWQIGTVAASGQTLGFETRQSKAEVTKVLLKAGYLPSAMNKNELKCDSLYYYESQDFVERCKTYFYDSAYTYNQRDYYALEFRRGRLIHIEFSFRKESFNDVVATMVKNYGSSSPNLVYGGPSSGNQYYWVLPSHAEIMLSEDTATGWSVAEIKDNSWQGN